MEEESALQNFDVVFFFFFGAAPGVRHRFNQHSGKSVQLRLENQFGAICKLIFISSGGLYESLQHCFWIVTQKSYMIHKKWILAEQKWWSQLEKAPHCCELWDDMCISEFTQITFVIEFTKSIHLTVLINLTWGCMPQLELYLCSGNEISEYFPHPQQFTADLHCYYSKHSCQSAQF